MDENVINKIIKMFRPYNGQQFINFEGKSVICGPDDRAVIGCTTHFPKEWLIDDFDFTSEQADWFINKVNELSIGDVTSESVSK